MVVTLPTIVDHGGSDQLSSFSYHYGFLWEANFSTGQQYEMYIQDLQEDYSNTEVQLTLFFGISDLSYRPILCPIKENQR